MRPNSKYSGFYLAHLALGFLGVWAIILYLNLNYSRDVSQYAAWFSEAHSLGFYGALKAIDWARDPAYYFLQGVGSRFISFPVYLGMLIFICLFLKLLATVQIFPRPTWLLVAPYLLCLGFLHEGTQLRIAIALSFIAWAIVLWAKDRFFLALIAFGVGCLFHLSVVIYIVIFGLLLLARLLGVYAYLLAASVVIAIMYFSLGESLAFLYGGRLAQIRYLHFLSPGYLKTQNSSGLFYLYPAFIAFITAINFKLYKPSDSVLKNLKVLAILSGIFAFAILTIFGFAVQIATRLADLLLLPPLMVLGAALVQQYQERRYLYWIPIVCALVAYAVMRSYVTFGPLLTKPLV